KSGSTGRYCCFFYFFLCLSFSVYATACPTLLSISYPGCDGQARQAEGMREIMANFLHASVLAKPP
ncbi:MAG TPA: hypothetical protein PLC15_22650, partial [Candidatus Obscuribacter sp.]|nr:hypothetical protein [Candidatus Obscuribacter sp.]HNG74833.1 hypothetical protein [Candidatus Obscuribacter sp.]